jgi:hypothetical protein
MIKIATDATTAQDAELIELYDAAGFSQYCITSIICGTDGTLYYKNDSANVLAVGVPGYTTAINLINAIGAVNTNSGTAIASARNAYEALNGADKALVTNYQTLVDAETVYDGIKSGEVIALIDAIGEVTLDSEAAVTQAENAYNALTDAQKSLVTNTDKLTAAKARLAELKAAKNPTGSTSSVSVTINGVTYQVSQTVADTMRDIEDLGTAAALEEGQTQFTQDQIQAILDAWRGYEAFRRTRSCLWKITASSKT